MNRDLFIVRLLQLTDSTQIWRKFRGSRHIEEDRERVIFCSIPDFERLLLISDNESFFLTLSAAKEEKFVGWHLPEIHREIHGKTQKKPFPFSLANVLPWWERLEEKARNQRHTFKNP